MEVDVGCGVVGVLQAVPTQSTAGAKGQCLGHTEPPALPCTLQKVSLNRHDRLGGTTLLGDDTSDTVADSLTNLPKNIQSQDEPDVGSSEECLPNLPGPQAWPPQKSGVQRLIWSRDR